MLHMPLPISLARFPCTSPRNIFIVASSQFAGRHLARSLTLAGVNVDLAAGTRDLGIYYQATQRHRAQQLKARFSASMLRLTKISILTCIIKYARKLVPISAFP